MSSVVVITGAASGLGAACAERFARDGWSVGAFDLAESQERPGVHAIQVDVTDPESVARGMGSVVTGLGRPRACLNVAGIYPRSGLRGFDVPAFRAIFDVNVLGTLLVAQAFVRERDATTQCAILNIASQDGYAPAPHQLLYSASKAAVINLTASMALELEPEDVRVNALAPGDIATERLRALRGGELGDGVADPAHVAEVCWTIVGLQALPLVSGQTIKVQASPLDRSEG